MGGSRSDCAGDLPEQVFTSIAEEMGAALRRTPTARISRERRGLLLRIVRRQGASDCDGRSHAGNLSAMPMSVKDRRSGEAANEGRRYRHPERSLCGQAHTCPTSHWYCRSLSSDSDQASAFYVNLAAHHADVGGECMRGQWAGAGDISGRHSHSSHSVWCAGKAASEGVLGPCCWPMSRTPDERDEEIWRRRLALAAWREAHQGSCREVRLVGEKVRSG